MDDDRGAPGRDEVLDALSSQVGIVLDHAGRVIAVTPAAHVVLGGRLAVGMDFVDLVVPDDRPLALTLLVDGSLASPVDAETVNVRCAHLDGSWRTLACRSRSAANGELVICADDVTARDRARAEIAVHDATVDVLQRAANLTFVFDTTTRLAEAGAPGTRSALYRVGDEQMELLATGSVPAAWARVAERADVPAGVASGTSVEPASGRLAELAAEHGLGFAWIVLGSDTRAGDATESRAPHASTALCVFVGAKRFLTAGERASLTRAADLAATAIALHDQMVAAGDQASFDPLTGVLARHAFFEALDTASRPVTLMLVHVGGIASVNAAHGYDAGDATLRAVALGLQGLVRRRDIVGRLSGATFAIAGPARTAGHEAERWADRVREAVRTRLVAAGRVLEPACRVTHVIGPAGLRAADVVLQAEAQLRGTVAGLADAATGRANRADAASGRRPQDR